MLLEFKKTEVREPSTAETVSVLHWCVFSSFSEKNSLFLSNERTLKHF